MPEGATTPEEPTMEQVRLQRIAEATRSAMYERDHAAKAHGIAITDIGPGYAKATMTVTKDMVNGHDILHGGLCFTLADTCFAYTCNSHNHVTVAQSCQITFCAAGKLGDVLTAEGRETWIKGRNGITDVTVTNQYGTVIALFRGNSRRLQGHVSDDPQFLPEASK